MTKKTEPRWLARYRPAGSQKTKRIIISGVTELADAVMAVRLDLWRLGKSAPKLFVIEPVR